ncbi:13558_t:CDS:2, partial [Cetraspora pellucida]
FGRPFIESHRNIYDTIDTEHENVYDLTKKAYEKVKATGKGSFHYDYSLLSIAGDQPEEKYIITSFNPIFKADGSFCAMFGILVETTEKILTLRRLKSIHDMGNRLNGW